MQEGSQEDESLNDTELILGIPQVPIVLHERTNPQQAGLIDAVLIRTAFDENAGYSVTQTNVIGQKSAVRYKLLRVSHLESTGPVSPSENPSESLHSPVDQVLAETDQYLRGSFVNKPWFPTISRSEPESRTQLLPWTGLEASEMTIWVDKMNRAIEDWVALRAEGVCDDEVILSEAASELFRIPGVTLGDLRRWLSLQKSSPPDALELEDTSPPEKFKSTSQPSDLLAGYTPTDDMLQDMERRRAALAGGEYVVGQDGSTGAMTLSSKQQGFRLDSIFDAAAGDAELFGLSTLQDSSEDDEEEEDEEEKEDHKSSDGATEKEKNVRHADGKESEPSVAELDSQVERILGKTSIANERERRQSSTKRGETWAEVDKTNVANFSDLLPNPVIVYPFDLDTFQKRAVLRLERGESVFVAAHTSAGKTVVAEYAIALCNVHRTKAIYTSPIKTLSNQKFRDFSGQFPSVGIVTGDVSINPGANCLVMTTEILRSMLYKGADIIRDIEWVIFDEVHYVSDEERGVVWEEVIIMLPEHVGMIMLSATVPNAVEFASWVGRTKNRKVHVISTPKRPVPLEHSVLVKKETFTLLDTNKQFVTTNYRYAVDEEKKQMTKIRSNLGPPGSRKHVWPSLANFLTKQSLTPTVVFCFSKRMCEDAVEGLRSLDLSAGASEKSQVHTIFDSAIKRLSPGDRELPQIGKVRNTLKRGIGMHHAGLLPIVKEITEILFQRGLVKALFATETFAMGVNMPARSVVFTSVRKHDGRSFRFLEPGEYIQMAGRAGRRGLDTVGTVLLYFPTGNIPSEMNLKAIMSGSPLRLRSQFRLTYNMILNLLRVEDLKVEDIIRRSFSESPAERDGSLIKKLLKAGKAQLAVLSEKRDQLVEFVDYFDTAEHVQYMTKDINRFLFQSNSTAMAVGRVVLVARHDHGIAVGVLLRRPRIPGLSSSTLRKGLRDQDSPESGALATVLCLQGGPAAGQSIFFDVDEISEGQKHVGGVVYKICEMGEGDILSICKKRLKVDVDALLPMKGQAAAEEVARVVNELRKIAESGEKVSAANPQKDLGITRLEIVEAWKSREKSLQFMMRHACQNSGRFHEAASTLAAHSKLGGKVETLEWAASDASLQLLPDYSQRTEVLRRLQYLTEDNNVQLKGRAACEVNSCMSLILVELVFENVLTDLCPAECAALLSTLVFEEKSEIEIETPENMVQAKSELTRILLALGTVQASCGLPVSAIEFTRQSARFGLLVPVLEWANGAPFSDICALTEIQEGTIVRCIVRLSDLLRETRNVARAIGDLELMAKSSAAMDLIKRDIIFAASLYLS